LTQKLIDSCCPPISSRFLTTTGISDVMDADWRVDEDDEGADFNFVEVPELLKSLKVSENKASRKAPADVNDCFVSRRNQRRVRAKSWSEN